MTDKKEIRCPSCNYPLVKIQLGLTGVCTLDLTCPICKTQTTVTTTYGEKA